MTWPLSTKKPRRPPRLLIVRTPAPPEPLVPSIFNDDPVGRSIVYRSVVRPIPPSISIVRYAGRRVAAADVDRADRGVEGALAVDDEICRGHFVVLPTFIGVSFDISGGRCAINIAQHGTGQRFIPTHSEGSRALMFRYLRLLLLPRVGVVARWAGWPGWPDRVRPRREKILRGKLGIFVCA